MLAWLRYKVQIVVYVAFSCINICTTNLKEWIAMGRMPAMVHEPAWNL